MRCVKNEIHNMLAALRHHSRLYGRNRWASEERFEREILAEQESPVLRSFKELQSYLDGYDDLRHASAPRFLAPFLSIVKSDAADASVTMVALRSLNKFLLYGFISESSPGAIQAINDLAHTLPRCRRFTESVLMILLDVTDLCVQNSAGRYVTGNNMHDLFQVCFRICHNKHQVYSKLLQQSAGSTLAHIIICLFSRLGELCEQENLTTASAIVGEKTSAVNEIDSNDQCKAENDLSGRQNSRKGTKSNANGDGDAASLSGNRPPKIGSTTANESYSTNCLYRIMLFLVSQANPSTEAAAAAAEAILRKSNEKASGGSRGVDDMDGTYREGLSKSGAIDTTKPSELQILALGMINTILETAGEQLGSHVGMIKLIQGDLCKFLLQSSQTDEPILLSLVLRTIFNMFCAVKAHLKVQFEVFFTSIHMGIIESSVPSVSSSFAEEGKVKATKELALESLLDFCREPVLMVDLYTNYDCDVQCSNLFEMLVRSLCAGSAPSLTNIDLATCGEKVKIKSQGDDCVNSETKLISLPTSSSAIRAATQGGNSTVGTTGSGTSRKASLGQLTTLHALAFECLLEVVNSIARRCQTTNSYETQANRERGYTIISNAASGATDPNQGEHYDGPLPISRSTSVTSASSGAGTFTPGLSSTITENWNTSISDTSPLRSSSFKHLSTDPTGRTLRRQKKRKMMMADAAARFNSKPRKGIAFALEVGLVDAEHIDDEEVSSLSPSSMSPTHSLVDTHLVNTETDLSAISAANASSVDSKMKKPSAESVAQFLHETPGLDKSVVGDYLAEPPDSHPFNTRVRTAYVARFDFRGMTFDGALRLFLSGFRLPGEAQKIDRLMEAFAGRLYEQMKESTNIPGLQSSQKYDVSCMKSAQALFVLCFSTIMLNTDLHNPNIKDDRKMTIEAFKKNNRGINDGDDVPAEFLERLYYNIKSREIQILPSTGGKGKATRNNSAATVATWDGLIQRQGSVEAAMFTPASVGRQAQLRVRAGVQEHDMFELIAAASYEAIETVFNSTRNISLRRRALDGFKNYAIVASYYGLQEHFDRLLILLCRQFISLCISTGDFSGANSTNSSKQNFNKGGKLFEAALRAEEKAKQYRSEKIKRMEVMAGANEEPELAESGLNSSARGGLNVHGNRTAHSTISHELGSGFVQLEHQRLVEKDPLLNSRAMLLITCIAHLTREHGHMVRHGWRKVAKCVMVLFEIGGLPSDLSHMPWSLSVMDGIIEQRDSKRFRKNLQRCSSEDNLDSQKDQAKSNTLKAQGMHLEQDFMEDYGLDNDSSASTSEGDSDEDDYAQENDSSGGLLSWVFGFGTSSEEHRKQRLEYRRVLRRLKRSVSSLDLGDMFDLSRTLPKEALSELTNALIIIRDPRIHFRHGSAYNKLESGVNVSEEYENSSGRTATPSQEPHNLYGESSGLSDGAKFVIPGTLDDPHFLRRFEKGSMLCVDLLCRVICSNPHRLAMVWNMTQGYFYRLLGVPNSEDSASLETPRDAMPTTPTKSLNQGLNGLDHTNLDHFANYLSPASAKPDTPQNLLSGRKSSTNNEYNKYLGAFVREQMPGLCGRIVMCIFVCIHRLIHRVPSNVAVVLLSALQGVVHRIPLMESPKLARAVGESTLQILMKNAKTLQALGQSDPEDIWGRFFQHLDWIVFIEHCRPSVWRCLVFMIKGTLVSGSQNGAESNNNDNDNTQSELNSSLPIPPNGTLVTSDNFGFVLRLLQLFIQPVMTDKPDYHRTRCQGPISVAAARRRSASGRSFAGIGRRTASRLMRPRTLQNSDEQSAVAVSLTQYMFASLSVTPESMRSETHISKINQNESEDSSSGSILSEESSQTMGEITSAPTAKDIGSSATDKHWMDILLMYRSLYYTGVLSSDTRIYAANANPSASGLTTSSPQSVHRPSTSGPLRSKVAREARRLLEDVLLGHCLSGNGTKEKDSEQLKIVVPSRLWPQVFEHVLFPLVGGSEVRAGSHTYGSAPHLRAVTLLSRVVLHNFESLACREEFYAIWLKLVGILTTLLRPQMDNRNSAYADNSMDVSISLDTTARESLKNLLLVAHHSGLLEHVSETSGSSSNMHSRDIWGPTWALVGSVSLPLCQEIERATQPAVASSPPAKIPHESVSQSNLGSFMNENTQKVQSSNPSFEKDMPGSTLKIETDAAEKISLAPILELDIKLAGGSSAALSVHPGDVPQDIAKEFAERHGLSLEKQLKLTKVIQASLAVPQ